MSIINCPNCKSTLLKFDKMLQCQNGHSFDYSKEGYINLLLANQKKTLNPGDNKEMMYAREAFLSTGHYNFLIDFVEAFISSINLNASTTNILDLGCGSGYYTRNLLTDSEVKKIGVDISKAGISKASKSDKSSDYIVGSVYDLPIADDSVDIVLNIFSPVSIDEVKRVLKPGGYFIKVVPDKDHMKEIASLVYDTFIPHQTSIESDIGLNSNFQVVKVEKLEKVIVLSDQNLYNLISMTPYLYKFEKGELEKLNEMSITISFKIIIAQFGASLQV